MARSSYPLSDRDLLARIARSAAGKAGYKQLIRELGLGGGRERRLLLEQLTRMVGRGELALIEDGLWAIPKRPDSQQSLSAAADTGGQGRQHALKTRDLGPEETRRRGGERFTTGRLDLHRDGYGFVRRMSPSTGQGRVNSPGDDIFIPPNALHGAMHGDLVLVDEDPPGRDGRLSGRVARVLTRRNPTVVGIFHYGAPSTRQRRPPRSAVLDGPDFRANFVQPWDERLGDPIEIPPGAEIVAESGSPHRTLGGPDARTSSEHEQKFNENVGNEPQIAQATRNAALASPGHRSKFDVTEGVSRKSTHPTANEGGWPLEGLAVEVEITSFAQPGRPARGRLIEILGPPDAFGVDVEIIIRKHLIPHTFPAHVLAEADELAVNGAAEIQEESSRREDFRGLPVVTIDGETARDFDDAVFVRPLPNGNTELQVHIADVSWYVREGSRLDTEARVRGTSVYFPDRAVPMLPHALSSGMCSLLPQQDRLVLSCVMEIDSRGEIAGYRVAEGVIRSARRMTYTSVQRCLNASPSAAEWNAGREITSVPSAEDHLERERIALEQPELPESFDRMLALALLLNRKRVRRGSIDFDLPEPVVEFDPDGNMKAIVRSERGWAHRLIEEFMLSANECVATWLTAQGIPSMYRIHEMPDPKRILDFEETAAAFGQTLGLGALPVKRLTLKSDRREVQRRSVRGRAGRPPQSHEIPESIPVTPQMYQALVRRIEGKPEERILAYLMLRSLKQARYSEKNEGHFALASPCYTHFTSPIRRYPDLIVHRLLRAMLRHGADPRGAPVLSTDPQPWAHAGRAETRSSVLSASREGLRAPAANAGQAALRVQPSPDSRLKTRGKRRTGDGPGAAGRIGWSQEGDRDIDAHHRYATSSSHFEPIAAPELADIAVESSQAERRAADAERELIEWKKIKFMADKIGDDFTGIILSVTKYGFFVELDELFIEGLVPLGSLLGDFYSFRDTDRTICGARTGHCFRVGDSVEVILDRIDRQQHRLQFALKPGTEPLVEPGSASLRKSRSESKKERSDAAHREKTKGRKRRKR